MRAYNALPLDDDILDHIFLFISDFDTLQALILTSKAFYAVFQAHSSSIVGSVAYNVVGPSLKQGVRYVRYAVRLVKDSHVARELGDEDDGAPLNLKYSEALVLVVKHGVVKRLEGRFSRKYKDRSSRSSVLTPSESWRFCRAMYRVMLFVEVFPWSAYLDDYEDEGVERVVLQHEEFLEKFSTVELQELYSVVLFLVELNRGMLCSRETGHLSYSVIALSCGPATTLAALEGLPDSGFWEELEDSNIPLEEDDDRPSPVHEYLLRPLRRVMEKRKVTLCDPNAEERWKSILDSIVGEDDLCDGCGVASGGFNLRNHTNWDTLREAVEKPYQSGVRIFLRGNLRSNVVHMYNFNTLFPRPLDHQKFMEEIFDLKRGQPFSGWKKEDWLCEGCIKSFIYQHLHFWVLEKKKQAGETIREDCQYGYDCEMQTKDADHAKNHNHYCEPTTSQ